MAYQRNKAEFVQGVRRIHPIKLIILFCILTSLVSAQPNGAIAYYPISGNTNDESGNGNHGVNYGATFADDRNGVPLSAIYFDGVDNYIDLGSDSTLKPQLPITFAAWIKIDTPDSNANNGAIFSSNFNDTVYYGVRISNNQLTDRLSIAYGDGTAIGPQSRRSIYIDVPPYNTWFHLVGIIRNELDMNIYVNGVDAGGIYDGSGGSLEYDNGPAYMGCMDSATNGPPNYLRGFLDEIILYDRAITEQEIDSLFNGNGQDSITLINVPDDQPTIQAGINFADHGDTVLVQPGTYIENIDFLGKNITVGSLTLTTGDKSYISQTIIDGDSSGSVVTFENGEDSTAMLYGFTITDGFDFYGHGGGIMCGNNTNPNVTNVIIANSQASQGGGVYCGTNSSPVLTNVSIYENNSYPPGMGLSYGGGIYCGWGSKPTLINSVISRNTSWGEQGPGPIRIVEGGGIYCDSAELNLENVTVSNNNGGIFSQSGSDITVLNSIIWYNTGNQIWSYDSSTITIGYSNISGGLDGIMLDDVSTVNWFNGNINAFPVFCDPDNGDYTLAENSPCVGTGEGGNNIGALGIGCGYISTDNLALRFDGFEDFVECFNLGLGNSQSTISVAMWIKPVVIDDNDGCWEFAGYPMGEFSLGIYNTFYRTETDGDLLSYNAAPADEWSHVVVTFDGSLRSLYLNGNLLGSRSLSTTLDLAVRSFVIGTTEFQSLFADGIIDEVSVWDIVRTEAEIQADMYHVLTGNELGLVGYWSFNEGAGDTTFDISGNGNGGIISGAEWVLSDIPMFSRDSITLIIVPDDQPTIQDAIGFADFGDTVLVMPGTYIENINFSGKNITVGSLTLTTGDTSYISQTIIDGDSIGSVVTFDSGEDSTAVLSGFTVTNGSSNRGGGIFIDYDASPKIMNMLVSENYSRGGGGGGIYCGSGSSPILTDVNVINNTVVPSGLPPGITGSGIHCAGAHMTLQNVAVIGNNSIGGGIYSYNSTVILNNVTIADNGIDGIWAAGESELIVRNSIIWGNLSRPLNCRDSSNIVIEYSNISGGLEGIVLQDSSMIDWGNGNINTLPLFCNPDSGDYTLAENSPCIGTGEGGTNMGALGIGCGYISTDNLALRFDGIDDEVFVGLTPDLDVIGDITISAWIKTTNPAWGTIVWNHDQLGPDNGYRLCNGSEFGSNGSAFFECVYNDIRDGFSTDFLINDGEWHFVTAILTPDGTSRGRIFIDAVEQSGIYMGAPISSIGATPDYPFKIGAADQEAFFDGIIDEIRIWDVVRTETEIQADMYRVLSGNEPGLVGYWSFNEGNGEIAHDISSYGNDGTILGAEWIISDIPMFGTDSITLIIVPDDQPTIQAGIDFATHGDTVLVMPGTYVENINFNGKNISVGSLMFTTGDTSYIRQTIIDGDSSGSVVTFVNWEDSTARLCGFSIVNGSGTIIWGGGVFGGGIYCINSSPTLSNLIVSDNAADTGGGIYFNSSNSQIANCRIMDNLPSVGSLYGGGGISAEYSDLILDNLAFTNNVGLWGAIISYSSNLSINSSSFIDTDTLGGSIIYCVDSSNVLISNSILWNPGRPEILIGDAGNALTVSHCNIEGGLDSIVVGDNTVNWLSGNIDSDPFYVDPENGYYQLMTCSPCIGAGANDSIPEFDIDGNPRPDPQGSQADMGAFEHLLPFPRNIPEIQVTQSALDFVEAYINFPDTMIYRISNWGCDILYIFAENNLVEYVVEPNFLALEQGEQDSFLVIFTPIYCSSYPDSLILTTNDQDESTIIVPLAGQGVLPPNISVYPYRYDLEMNLDLLETHTSVISNTGGSDLEFEIAMDDQSLQGGYALQFDGDDDYVDCGDLGFESSSDSITVAMWLNPDTLMGDYGYWEFTGASAQFFLSIHDGSYHMGIAGQYFEYHANPAGEWANLAVTFDGLEHSFYLNGELQGSNQVTYPAFFDLFYRPFWIGFGGFPAFADGTIDAVMVWNTVRSQAQISSDMYRTVAYNEPGLVGYWRFNEGIGDSTLSYTSDSHTGTIYGSAEWIESTAPITSWITVQPLSGTIESSGSQDITITLDASNLLLGDYQTEIRLFSNDPGQGLITIPVSLTTVVSVEPELQLPTTYQLHQNYPNPFNPVTTIRYDLPQDSRVKLTIYNILGQQVIVLADEYQIAGYKSIRWNGRTTSGKLVGTGMYFYSIEASQYSAIRKMVLLK